ncbi:MAG: hypothetical protein RLN75_07100 [Longimicrobiales bacterium]
MRRFLGVVLGLALAGTGLAGQESRSALVDQALSTSDEAGRLDLLVRALDPALGVPDSAWALGAFDMAFRLTDMGREEEAGHWLRWAVREGARLGLTPDDFPGLFPQPLVSAFVRARAQVEAQASPADDAVASAWNWPGSYAADADGTLIVRLEGAGVGAEAEVEGVGTVGDGEAVALAPGTYRILVSGDGVEPLSVQREVLPGVTRSLTVAATPVLFPGVEARAGASLVRLQWDVGGSDLCTTGVVVADTDGLVVAPLNALEAPGVELIAADGRRFSSLAVPVRDPALGVGVARLGDQGLRVPDTGAEPSGPTWVLDHDGCGPARTERVSLGAAGSDGVAILDGAPAASAGGTVLDQQGRLVALALGTNALSAAGLADLVERARRPTVAAVQPPEADGDGGGGFPIKWVAAGAAAVGVAALLLSGGGNGDDRTGIVLTWPGG